LPKSNLATRLITAFTAGPLVLLLVFLGPAWAWFAFLTLAGVLGASELFGMTHPGDRLSQAGCSVLTLVVMGSLWWLGTDARTLLTLIVLLPLAGLVLTLARLGDIRSSALRAASATFGPLYLGGGLAALALVRRDAGSEGSDGPGFVLLTMFLAWLSDTGGYFVGRRFGRHKLYPAVSPNKTVEGALGGVGGAIVGALITHLWVVRSLPLTHALGLAVVAGCLGQLGDLGESMIKRSVGVKDSGGLIPGHGGVLDRVDALLVTSVVTYLYVLWMG
jgi:phosphatidate cytidylyltransferase